MKLLSATLEGLVVSRPDPTQKPQHWCFDAAYDSTPVYRELLDRHHVPHVRSRGEEQLEQETIPGYRARRWVVELGRLLQLNGERAAQSGGVAMPAVVTDDSAEEL